MVVGVLVIGLVDNVLRPAMLSGRAQMNGLLMFVSLLGGISAFGFLGLVLGPVVMATAFGVLDAYTKDRRTPVRDDRGGGRRPLSRLRAAVGRHRTLLGRQRSGAGRRSRSGRAEVM